MTSFNALCQTSYTGYIGKYPVKFYINSDFPEHNSYYSYSKYNKIIELTGGETVVNGMCTGKLLFFEKDKNGGNTAQFTFENFDTRKWKLEGVWTDLISKKLLKVELSKDNAEKVKKISKEDSTIIKNHSRKLNIEALVDRYATDSIPKPKYDIIVKKILSVDEEKYDDHEEYERVIKKILLENKVTDEEQYQEQQSSLIGLRWGEGNVYYSPDETFKVFVFEGESCGGNCFPEYDSFIQLKSGKIASGDGIIGFTPIISIFKTGTNTYGAIQTSWSGGNIGRVYYNLDIFSIVNDTIKYIPLKIENKKQNDDSDSNGFQLSSHQSIDAYLEYNNIRNKIQFHYERFKDELFDKDYVGYDSEVAKKIPKQLLPFKDDEILVVKGEFEIVDGKIANYKEWYEKKKESHDEN